MTTNWWLAAGAPIVWVIGWGIYAYVGIGREGKKAREAIRLEAEEGQRQIAAAVAARIAREEADHG